MITGGFSLTRNVMMGYIKLLPQSTYMDSSLFFWKWFIFVMFLNGWV